MVNKAAIAYNPTYLASLPWVPESVLRAMGPRTRQVAVWWLEHPGVTITATGKHFGLSRPRTSRIINSNRFLKFVKQTVSGNLGRSVNVAANEFMKCIEQNKSFDVKLRASQKLLEDQKILGAPTVNINTKTVDGMSVEEMREIVNKARQVKPQTIDAELA